MALKSKGLSDESIKPPAVPDNSCSTKLDYFNNPKFQVKFNGSCVTIDKDFHPNKIINLYFVFEIKLWPFYSGNGFILKNSLLGAVKLKKKILILISILDMLFHLMLMELLHCQAVVW